MKIKGSYFSAKIHFSNPAKSEIVELIKSMIETQEVINYNMLRILRLFFCTTQNQTNSETESPKKIENENSSDLISDLLHILSIAIKNFDTKNIHSTNEIFSIMASLNTSNGHNYIYRQEGMVVLAECLLRIQKALIDSKIIFENIWIVYQINQAWRVIKDSC